MTSNRNKLDTFVHFLEASLCPIEDALWSDFKHWNVPNHLFPEVVVPGIAWVTRRHHVGDEEIYARVG